MDRSYCLVNSNTSRIRMFIENTNNKDQFFKYMFIDSGKVTSKQGKEPTIMTTRERLKKEAAKEEQKKLIAPGWRTTKEDWANKKELGLLILNRRLNITQLLTNGDSSNERVSYYLNYYYQSRKI